MIPDLPYRHVTVLDFEFQAGDGERPEPVCLVWLDRRSGQVGRMWRDELRQQRQAPYPAGDDAVVVTFYASAELGCHIALGWAPPVHVIDLYVENQAALNGLVAAAKDQNEKISLLRAMALHGLDAVPHSRKQLMRDKIIHQDHWSPAEQADILDYCEGDVRGTDALLSRMLPKLDLKYAQYRGRFAHPVALMEWHGVPMNVPLLRELQTHLDGIAGELIDAVDSEYDVYDHHSFKQHLFEELLVRRQIEDWPRYGSGQLRLDDDTFRTMATSYPELQPLHDLRSTLGKLRKGGLPTGKDGRNRCLISPFGSKTGRNQPSNSRFIFGASGWLRRLIKPTADMGLACIDYTAQELTIAAIRSGDQRLIDACQSGDPYLAFAVDAGLAPTGATEASHGEARSICKIIQLGLLYGMRAPALARRLRMDPIHGARFLRLHQDTYRQFWRWSEETVDRAMVTNEIATDFNWRLHVTGATSATTLANFPMQATGAEIMRVACTAVVAAGVKLLVPIHDALLIEAPLDCLDEAVRLTCELMERAAEMVVGLRIRTSVTMVRYPDSFPLKAARAAMWNRVTGLLEVQRSKDMGRLTSRWETWSGD